MIGFACLLAIFLGGLMLFGFPAFAGFALGRATAPQVAAPTPSRRYAMFNNVENPETFSRMLQKRTENQPGSLGKLGKTLGQIILTRTAFYAAGAATGTIVVPLVLDALDASDALAWLAEVFGDGVEIVNDIPEAWESYWSEEGAGLDTGEGSSSAFAQPAPSIPLPQKGSRGGGAAPDGREPTNTPTMQFT